MCANRWIAFFMAFVLGFVVALRHDNVDWSRISPDDDPDSYKFALDSFRLIVLPKLNAERAQCDLEVALTFYEMLIELLLVETSEYTYRLTFNSAFEVQFKELVVTIDKSGERWSSIPHPCELASSALDAPLPLIENDRFVEVALRTLMELSETQCRPEEIFVPNGVLDAVMVEGTRNEQVVMHVSGPGGPHRVHFEFSGAKATLLSSDVPVCDLTRPPPQDSSIMQIWGGLSAPKARAKRLRRLSNEIYKRSRTSPSPSKRTDGHRLPTYTGPLELEFNWAQVAPECFGYGPEVQDQGSCGAGWAFATLGALSDRHCLTLGKNAMSLSDGGLRRFSVQDILSCHLDSNDDGCLEGTLSYAAKALMNKKLSFEDQSPYFSKCYLLSTAKCIVNNKTEEGLCPEYKHLPDHPTNKKPCVCWAARPRKHSACDESLQRREVQVGWGSIPAFGDLSSPKQIEFIMRYIREDGPVAASFNVWDDFRPFVFFAPDVPYYRRDPNARYLGAHAVVITGWGASKDGVPYWWARNSWGTDWGTKGYFKIARGSNSVGFEHNVYFAIVKERVTRKEDEYENEVTHTTFGIRLPWSDDLVSHRGKLVREEMSTHLYTFLPTDIDGGPIMAVFHTDRAKVKRDVYMSEHLISGQLVPGNFFLLAVEIPFECSEPCMIRSAERYQAQDPSEATLSGRLRCVGVMDDDSWSRGKLVLYMGKDDPLQGTSKSEIKVIVQSRFRYEVLSQLKEEGVDIDKVKDWNRIPVRASDHIISLPDIPLHNEPGLLLKPVAPLTLHVDFMHENGPHHRYLKLALLASEPSVYIVSVFLKDTTDVLLSSVAERPPDRLALLYIGGNRSLGGSSFQSFFDEDGRGFGKKLSIEVEASCAKYAEPLKTIVKKDFQWPR